jgi:putative Ca2+/H+ antiporter (TMEM165/GDT1 family)
VSDALTILLGSFSLVAASEMGDKTQLLAFSLAARFKKPFPILCGILVATILNHALAAALGSTAASWLDPKVMGYILGSLFIIFGFWTLKPDTLDETPNAPQYGAFLTTAFLFFLAEMGDKTQFATITLAAKFQSAVLVTIGTTLGMMLTDGLAVLLGDRLAHKVQMKWIRIGSAILFFIFGFWTFFETMVL